jgi:hemolysin D
MGARKKTMSNSPVAFRPGLSKAALDFAPGLLAIQESPPTRLPRVVIYTVAALLAFTVTWSVFGKLDVVATAEGHLVPQSYVKVVQPADAGIVKDILVHEGEYVTAGQVLLRMDAQDSRADAAKLRSDLALRSLQLRRVDAELVGRPLTRAHDEPVDLFGEVAAQYRERRQNYLDALAQSQEHLSKAERDSESGQAVLAKLTQTNPILKSQAQAYAGLGEDGYVPKVTVSDKQRAYIENEQDLKAQESTVQGLAAAVREAAESVQEITSKYRSELRNERVEAEGEFRKLEEDLAKQEHHTSLLDMKAPQSGIVKDLATHTIGTVVATGTVLLSIVPEHEPLLAEVLVRNEDIGFVHSRQTVKIKLAAYPFQKYGLLDGRVQQIWPDASQSDASATNRSGEASTEDKPQSVSGFKALVSLDRQTLVSGTDALSLVPGMQVVAEIKEGRRSVLEYLLSPIRGAMHDSGRER